MENQSPGRDDRKCQPSLRDFWWPCASIPALKCRAIFKGSSGTLFHRGSRREEALISDLKSESRYLVSYSPATVPAPRAEKFLGRMTEGQVRQIEDALLEWLVIRRQD